MYSSSLFKLFPNIVHAVSSKEDGNLAFTWGEINDVVVARKYFLEKIHVPIGRCISISLEHGIHIIEIEEHHAGNGMLTPSELLTADALMTSIPNLFFFLLTGDCLPIAFFDPEHKAVALVHAGRKGIDAQITPKAIAAMHMHIKHAHKIFL